MRGQSNGEPLPSLVLGSAPGGNSGGNSSRSIEESRALVRASSSARLPRSVLTTPPPAALAAVPAAAASTPAVLEPDSYAILFEAFERAMNGRTITEDDPLYRTSFQALSALGLIGAEIPSIIPYQSKKEWIQFTSQTGDAFYTVPYLTIRGYFREKYRKLVERLPLISQSYYLKVLELDEAQDKMERKKVYELLQLIGKDQEKLSGLQEFHKSLLAADIRASLSSVIAEYKSRTRWDKLSGMSGALAKILGGMVAIIAGYTQFSATPSPSYCPGPEVRFPLNTTLAEILHGFHNISCVPTTTVNGTMNLGYCIDRSLGLCDGISATRIMNTLAIVGGVVATFMGIIELFIVPQIYTDLKTPFFFHKDTGLLCDMPAIEEMILDSALEIQDYSVQEKLIAAGVSSVKAGLPKSGHVDVRHMVQQTLQAFKQSLSHR